MIFGAIPPPRNFAKIRTRGGRGLLAEQPKDSIPPWGHSGTRRRGAAAVPEPGGRGGKTAVCRGGSDAGGLFAGAACGGRCARRHGGRFRRGSRGLFARRRAANGARARLGRVGPTKAACRARRRGAGTFPGSGARAVYGGFPGRTRRRRGPGGAIRRAGRVYPGRRAYYRGAAAQDGQKRSELRGLCRVTGHRWE